MKLTLTAREVYLIRTAVGFGAQSMRKYSAQHMDTNLHDALEAAEIANILDTIAGKLTPKPKRKGGAR
jgi:hypothetical protein